MGRGPAKKPDPNAPPRVKQKPGPKPKLTSAIPKRQVTRVERSYSREKMREVLSWLKFHKVHDEVNKKNDRRRRVDPYRAPRVTEAAKWFKIPVSTIYRWREHEASIVGPKQPRKSPTKKTVNPPAGDGDTQDKDVDAAKDQKMVDSMASGESGDEDEQDNEDTEMAEERETEADTESEKSSDVNTKKP